MDPNLKIATFFLFIFYFWEKPSVSDIDIDSTLRDLIWFTIDIIVYYGSFITMLIYLGKWAF